MGNLKKSTLNEYGFKIKSLDKKKYFFNENFGIRLDFTGTDKVYKNNSDIFIEKKGERYNSNEDINHLMTKCNFKKLSEFFKKGLPEQNLKQGENAIFSKNKQKALEFMTQKDADILSRAIFNYLISSGLMNSSSSGPIFSYQIMDYKYEYKSGEKVLYAE